MSPQKPRADGSKRLVSPIAKRSVGGVLAVAQDHSFLGFNGELDRIEVGSLVGPIAKGLSRGLAARTPIVVSGVEF
jgi:hypothetical protein